MPLYTYMCTKCKKIIEQNRNIYNRDNYKKCFCKKGQLKRMIDLSNFMLKGSGWSKDGYTKTKN